MNRKFILVDVYREGRWEKWHFDITNLGVESLILLGNELSNTNSYSSIRSILLSEVCSATFCHQFDRENKKESKKKKLLVRSGDYYDKY